MEYVYLNDFKKYLSPLQVIHIYVEGDEAPVFIGYKDSIGNEFGKYFRVKMVAGGRSGKNDITILIIN